ncbi:tRNA glutamyl-Q synthetase [Pontibacter qinzhouensis]|uniref:tRNA glutamyl-Q synthetase n=1 Tax=Pontibacter qinzhouensis TaxID=2603253 RepID=A0A5C8JM93_9BACT|nr:glutamate--tRNA ligase family protein [Pontibacter qinzhouensis]TXK38136.1 tRNA glutamyl-Q synthetase [Pontibacter qinzhouensis]
MEPQKPPLAKARIRTRIAPTPSGYLHLGNVLSFALTWALARSQNGTIALRIDDLDNTRFRPEYLHNIFETLQFMGIDYDEGPASPDDFLKNYSQHQRLPLYRQLLDQLQAKNLLYACPCSRSQIAAVSPQGLYPLTCRSRQVPLSEPGTAWRIRVPEHEKVCFYDQLLQQNYEVPLWQQMPDFVVRRKDGIPAYQVASVCDDLQMGINLVVRGQDLLTSTAAQVYLAACTGNTAFANMQFFHHPLLLNAAGDKLSKSDGALSVHHMRQQGLSKTELWQLLAQLLGWQGSPVTDAHTFLERFKQEEVPVVVEQRIA